MPEPVYIMRREALEAMNRERHPRTGKPLCCKAGLKWFDDVASDQQRDGIEGADGRSIVYFENPLATANGRTNDQAATWMCQHRVRLGIPEHFALPDASELDAARNERRQGQLKRMRERAPALYQEAMQRKADEAAQREAEQEAGEPVYIFDVEIGPDETREPPARGRANA